MNEDHVVSALGALAHPQRLRTFRALVVAGLPGLTPSVDVYKRQVPTVIGVVLLSFFLLQAVPGDAADVIAAESGSATEASMAALRSHFGLDQPVLQQLGAYPVSYTHLDVYKRQRWGRIRRSTRANS